MRTRIIGVVTALAAITVIFAAIVLTIAAIQDYQENKGQSFIERAASIVGLGTIAEQDQVAQVRIEVADDDESAELPQFFRFFDPSEDTEEWLDDLFDRERLDRDYEYRFEDRTERSPGLPRFERFEELPFDSFEFEGPWRTDWIDNLVERGVMTEEDADEFKSWFDDLPNELGERLPDFSDDHDFEFDSDDGRFRFRWRWDSSDDGALFEFDRELKNGV